MGKRARPTSDAPERTLTLSMALHAQLPMQKLLDASHEAQTRDARPEEALSLRSLRRASTEELYRWAKAETPYGRVVKELCFDKPEVGEVKLEYICPFAFLWLTCHECPELGDFLLEHLENGCGHAALYIDEITPGNPNRPDKGRAYHAC